MLPVNPFDRRARRDPYPIYLYMRTVEPVYRSPLGFWILTRYADCRSVLEDPRWSHDADNLLEPNRKPTEPVDPLVRLIRASIAFSDPPDHARHRRPLETAVRSASRGMAGQADKVASSLMDLLHEKGMTADIVQAYAAPLALYVMADLLGLPAEERGQLHRWGREIAAGLDPAVQSGGVLRAGAAAMAIVEYMQGRIDAARDGKDFKGVLGRLAGATPRLSTWELIADLTTMLVTGVEATCAFIGNAVLALIANPDQMALLRRQPELLNTSIEELIRFDGPIHLTARVAAEDVPVGKSTVPKGEQVIVLLGAANRDPARFVDPDRLDLARADNPHLGFGAGAHSCFAAAFARSLTRSAIATLLGRVSNLELDGTPEWNDTVTLRGLSRLPVKFTA